MGDKYDGSTPVQNFVDRVQRAVQRMRANFYEFSDSDLASFIKGSLVTAQLDVWASGNDTLRDPASSAALLEELSRVLQPRTDLADLACQKALHQPADTAVGQFDELTGINKRYRVPQPSGEGVHGMIRCFPAQMQMRLPLLLTQLEVDRTKHSVQLLHAACVTYDSQEAQQREERQRQAQQQLILDLQEEVRQLRQQKQPRDAAGQADGGGRGGRGGRFGGGRGGGCDSGGGRGRGRGGRPAPAVDDEGDLGPLAEGPGGSGSGSGEWQWWQQQRQQRLVAFEQAPYKAAAKGRVVKFTLASMMTVKVGLYSNGSVKRTVQAHLDYGCNGSCISTEFLQQNWHQVFAPGSKAELAELETPLQLGMFAGDQHTVITHVVCGVELVIGDGVYVVDMLVVPGANFSLVLGNDFAFNYAARTWARDLSDRQAGRYLILPLTASLCRPGVEAPRRPASATEFCLP
ncbi:hypothetical protein OEZ86_004671 [Tetradesmus obliquus]|nr:hypothetical protein OEZ86_004671 [Tetradesmus obliquus]